MILGTLSHGASGQATAFSRTVNIGPLQIASELGTTDNGSKHIASGTQIFHLFKAIGGHGDPLIMFFFLFCVLAAYNTFQCTWNFRTLMLLWRSHVPLIRQRPNHSRPYNQDT